MDRPIDILVGITDIELNPVEVMRKGRAYLHESLVGRRYFVKGSVSLVDASKNAMLTATDVGKVEAVQVEEKVVESAVVPKGEECEAGSLGKLKGTPTNHLQRLHQGSERSALDKGGGYWSTDAHLEHIQAEKKQILNYV